MTDSEINRYRLESQHITTSEFTAPGELVGWFGAMQGQDYPAARWAVGLRLPGITDESIEAAIANRSVIRTWALRGTLHLIAANDVRWILELLQPRLQLLSAGYLRRLELDASTLTKSYDVMIQAMQGGKQLIRTELKTALERAGIAIYDIRLNLLLSRAAFDGLICCGVRRGSENTYTLLDEWIPATNPRERNDALAALTMCYFRSHGPATLPDFVWWSGLTVREARAGIDTIQTQLVQQTTNGQTYWMVQHGAILHDPPLAVHLLPSFDEYLVGYKDRRSALGALDFKQIVSAGNGVFNPVVVLNGQVAGTWKRTVKKNGVLVETSLFYPVTRAQREAIDHACQQYGLFKQMPMPCSVAT